MAKSRADELLSTIRTAQLELNDIQAAHRDKVNAALLGKCFRYRNSFSGDNHWWLYVKVIGAEDGYVVVHKFERRGNGEFLLDPHHTMYGRSISDDGSYKPIDNELFQDEWNAFVSEIEGMLP